MLPVVKSVQDIYGYNYNFSPMMKLLTLLLSLIGLIGLAIGVYIISLFIHPEASLLLVLGISFAAYIFMIMIMLMGMSLIEMMIVIILITISGLSIIFSIDDMLSNTIELLVWSLISGAWYMPVFGLSLARLVGEEDNASETSSSPSSFKAASERQTMIEKSLARRKRKQARKQQGEDD